MKNLFLLIFLCFQFGESAKLSVPRILLPYNTGVPTNYTLEVKEGGCYKWSSSRYDLVTVTPLPSDRERASCTTKAIVSAVSRYPERENAIILVEDEKSGQILRCDIVIDSVHSVEIITTTRVLFLEDAPEAFEVVAKNDQGDTFTNLAGVAFQWSLESDSLASDAYGVLRFLKFADSVYKTPPSVEYWEKQNLHGSMILMEGSKTGSAKVTVKPLDPAYKHVASYDVSLVVVANLNLKPAHTYVLPGTKVKYQLELIKQGKAFPISLPSDQYYLEVADKSVATLNEAVAVVTALKYGTTNIVVKDRYISGREIAYLPSAVIHVTPPSYLTLSVSPGDKWSLEEKKDYSVLVSVYDRNSHPIYLTEEVRVAIQFPQKYFLVKMSSSNGTYQEIRTLIPGSTVINAHLLGIAKKDGSIMRIEPTVSASQDVIIYESIKVHPSQTLLPWDPISKPVYSIFLKATGGTGIFNWMSGDTALASVHAVYEQEETIARVSTFGLGTFTVHAIDAHIPAFNGSGQVSIQPVVDLEILPEEVEVELNSTLILPVAMYGYLPDNKVKMFSNCSQVSISVVIDEIQKFIHEKDISSVVKPSACRNIHLKCIAKGFNRIRVRYERDDISLKKAAVVACYRKLKVVHPVGEAVIAIGSSLEILLEGGPQPWPRCQSHFVNLSPEHESIDMSVLRNDSDISDIHKVYASCRNFGEGAFTLKVGNKPCDSNPHPAVNQALIRVLCAIPESLTLRPILPAIQGKKCPVSGDNRIAIHSAENVDLELIVKDSYGREFHNISSLDVKWYVSDSSLAHLSSSTGVKTKLVKLKDMQYKVRYYQHLQPYGTEGDLKITASISGYKQNLNIEESIYDERFTTINSSVNFILVEEAEVEPKKASVFNSPSSKVYLNVTKGSGHFQVEASDPSKADVLYNSATNQIEITPLETGSITITINDLCLGIVHRAVAEVQIYGISAVVVDLLDKVELGKTIIASVEVLNEDKQRIPASVFTLMNLQAVSTSEIISVNLFSKPEPHQFQALYSIKGLSLGHTNFKVITKANIFKGVQYSSITYPIQVFPPLDLNPDHIILVVGGTFQVLCSGGPQPQSNIEYSIDDSDIAVVSACGTVEAKKVGKTAVIARAVGLDKKGNSVIYSEDKTLVSCISLKEVKIHAPLSRMVAGTEMPLYAVGHTELESPFTFGTAAPSAKFKWSVSNDKVASINTVYSSVGLQESSSNNFRVVLKALQDGLVTVRLEVTLPKETSISFLGGSQILSAEIQIQVFKRLRLTNPEVEDGMIIMSPNSQLKLKCNRLGIAKVSYKVLESTNKVNLAPVISVDESGTLFASSKLGSSILQVTAVEEFRITQDLSVIVKVEETAYLMLKPVGTIMTRDWPLTVLPVGFTVPFVVTYHNNIGQVFDAVRSHLQYRASRPNSARVSFGTLNNTLSVQVVKPGFTVLKVWDVESSIPPDYIQILTGTAIDPADIELTVGDVICFGSPLVTQEGHSGVWSSSKAILAVHPISGGAVALNAGQAVVIYSLLNGFSTSTTVTVKDAAYISIEPGNVNQISNLPRLKPYKIYIVIQSNETHRINNLVGKNCTSATENSMPLPIVPAPFSCELNFLSSSADISVNDLFHSSSGFDIEKGMYFCSIESVGKIPLNEASTLEGQLSLTVHLLSAEHTGLLSQQLLSFMPAFHVQQDELVLSDIQNINHVIVSATPAVQRCLLIVPSDPTVLRVKPPVLHPIFPASVTFQVELHDVNFLLKGDLSPLYVEISCPITKQQVKIPVRIKRLEVPLDGNAYCQPLPLPPATEFYYDWYLIMKIASASLCIIIVFYFIRWLTSARRGIVTSQPVFLHSTSSNGSQSFSPTHRSFTPSPFRQRYSPSSELENLSQPMRLCHLETSPKSLQRRRVDNVFR
ncbi:nuclear pore membrane glycoprotein 210 [Trichonephila clavata]|uniref:Nuclear pore membrane glycoprotein 210 n=1 Tax=Trichonephila clavata TaxID=2740835 RepID=A0A8X6J6J8_TRICU|nr:nuclear pore membrane glycoprotein 210 [Trichonephila clavata]